MLTINKQSMRQAAIPKPEEKLMARFGQVAGNTNLIATTCGHPTHQAMRVLMGDTWATFCLDCWRRNRRSYTSLISRPGTAL